MFKAFLNRRGGSHPQDCEGNRIPALFISLMLLTLSLSLTSCGRNEEQVSGPVEDAKILSEGTGVLNRHATAEMAGDDEEALSNMRSETDETFLELENEDLESSVTVPDLQNGALNEWPSQEELEATIEGSDAYIYVCFDAPWRQNNNQLRQVMRDLAERYPDVLCLLVDANSLSEETLQHYLVRDLPQFAVFKNGKIMSQVSGFHPGFASGIEDALTVALEQATVAVEEVTVPAP